MVLNGLRNKFNADLIDMLPGDEPLIHEYKQVISNFNPLDNLYVDIHAVSDDVTPDDLIAVGDEVFAKLEESKMFSRISYKTSFAEMTGVIDVFKKHRAVLFTDTDRSLLSENLTPQKIEDRLKNWKNILTESPAPFISQSFIEDPIGINESLLKKLELVQSFGSSMRFQKGRLFSKDFKHLLMIATPIKLSTDPEFSEEIVSFLTDLIARAQTPGIQVAYLGGHRYAIHNAAVMKSDVQMASTLSTIAIILVAFLIFRRRIMLPLFVVLPALFGCLTAFGLAPFFADKVSLVAIGCGTMLMGIAIDYGVHILYHLDQYKTVDEKTISKLMQGIVRPLLMSAATTIVAFLCLQTSILPVYHEFSWFATSGIIGTLLFVLIVLPTLLVYLKPNDRTPILKLTNVFHNYYTFITRRKVLFGSVLTIFTLICIFGLRRITFDGEVNHLYATTPEIKRDMDLVNASFGDAIRSSSVIAKGKNLESALQVNDQIYAELKRLQGEKLVQSFHSLSPLMPSGKEQKENRERWLEFWPPNKINTIKTQVDNKARAQRMNPAAFEEFFTSLPGETPEINLESYDGSFLEKMFATQVAEKDETLILSSLKLNTYEDFLKLNEILRSKFKNIIVVNARHFVEHVVSIVRGELARLGIFSLIAVSIILLIFYGLRMGLMMLAPLFVSLLWTFGLMGWFDIPINIMNCVIVLFIFGLVMDCSVFLVSAFHEMRTSADREFLERSSGAVAVSSLTTIFGVGVLALTQHPSLFIVGITVLIGMTASFAAILLVVPLCAEMKFFRK